MKPHVPFHEGVTVWGSLRNNLIVKDGFYMQFRKSILFLSIIGLMFLSSSAFAHQSGDFTYTVSGDTVTITKYTGTGGAVVIPVTIGDSKAVVGIGDSAFAYCHGLTNVTSSPAALRALGVVRLKDAPV